MADTSKLSSPDQTGGDIGPKPSIGGAELVTPATFAPLGSEANSVNSKTPTDSVGRG